MGFNDILNMIAGLALFLYGMHVLGDGLSKASGGRMERVLESLTNSTWKGVLLGAAVTAVIQSSSATTVMVVGFVNSGIMKLSQAIGIIMGANVGTTVTSWLLSLTGIQSDNIFLSLLKPSSFAPILAIIGVAIIMFSKKSSKRNAATIMIGFAVLMIGMETMSNAVKPLADVPKFTNILLKFSNPLLGLLAGVVLTAVIQSSSASVGILQALCVTGAIKYSSAVPIILGQNIGTCVTAMISSVGTSKNARRAALVHLYFNIIGTFTFLVLYYVLSTIFQWGFVSEAADASGIAIVHTIFNVFATVILLPFTKQLEKLAYLTIRDDEKTETAFASSVEEDLKMLDPRFLSKPGLAIEQCRIVTYNMANVSKNALLAAVSLLNGYSEETVQKVIDLEEDVDRYEDELGTYLVKLSAKSMSEKDSTSLSILLHCIGDFERISDHAVNIAQAYQEMDKKAGEFSKKAISELEIYTKAILDILDIAMEVFEKEDLELALKVEPLEEVIDGLNAEVKKRHIKRLRKGKCTIEMGFVLSDIITSYERISDHCSNIAVNVMQIKDDNFEVHEYKNNVKNGQNKMFNQLFEEFKEKYSLPKKKELEEEI